MIIQFCNLTEIVGIVHAGIHALSSLGRVRVASVTGDKNTFVHGELGCDPLADCISCLEKYSKRDGGRRTYVNRPPLDPSGVDGVGLDHLFYCLRIKF